MARRNPSKMAVLFHFAFGLLTGGLWWIILLIHHMLKK
ncbi:hypothetical protein SEA_LILHUDDY_50 [Arthrobacter phage LilHuddy]|nr:hypothetical protein SEA_LILHUDDY_50 [Arthrobacter phage LilHuddy]